MECILPYLCLVIIYCWRHIYVLKILTVYSECSIRYPGIPLTTSQRLPNRAPTHETVYFCCCWDSVKVQNSFGVFKFTEYFQNYFQSRFRTLNESFCCEQGIQVLFSEVWAGKTCKKVMLPSKGFRHQWIWSIKSTPRRLFKTVQVDHTKKKSHWTDDTKNTLNSHYFQRFLKLRIQTQNHWEKLFSVIWFLLEVLKGDGSCISWLWAVIGVCWSYPFAGILVTIAVNGFWATADLVKILGFCDMPFWPPLSLGHF